MTDDDRPRALYLPTRDGFEPTPLTGGPWRPDAQHGGPPSALLGRALESEAGPEEFIARVSVELVRPVPLSELLVQSSRERVSRRVTHVHARLIADGTVAATATALCLTRSELPDPAWAPHEASALPGPDATVDPPVWTAGSGETAEPVSYHRHAVEHRFVSGAFDQPGPAVVWVRLRQPLVAGEEVSPLCRVLAAADFGSGVSAIYRFQDGVGLINADLTVSLQRDLVGDWVGLDATTRVGGDGIGLGTTMIFDEAGQLGMASQSLLGLVL